MKNKMNLGGLISMWMISMLVTSTISLQGCSSEEGKPVAGDPSQPWDNSPTETNESKFAKEMCVCTTNFYSGKGIDVPMLFGLHTEYAKDYKTLGTTELNAKYPKVVEQRGKLQMVVQEIIKDSCVRGVLEKTAELNLNDKTMDQLYKEHCKIAAFLYDIK